MNDNIFYFVALVGIETVTVIDLAQCVDYERDEWRCIDDANFYELHEAIIHARKIAKFNNLEYREFRSRYGGKDWSGPIKQYPENYEL